MNIYIGTVHNFVYQFDRKNKKKNKNKTITSTFVGDYQLTLKSGVLCVGGGSHIAAALPTAVKPHKKQQHCYLNDLRRVNQGW